MAQTTLAQLSRGAAVSRAEEQADSSVRAIPINMETVQGFAGMREVAQYLSGSALVPDAFRGKPANCFIAVDIALRTKTSPMMVMQNLNIIQGKPSWSTAYLVGLLNNSGRFTALRYQWRGESGKDNCGCRAHCTELATGEMLYGPWVTIGMARAEGWYGRKGSKWQTMPQLMLGYRAAAFFVRTYAPEIMLGLYTEEEQEDIEGTKRQAPARRRSAESRKEPEPVEALAEPVEAVEVEAVEAEETEAEAEAVEAEEAEAIAEIKAEVWERLQCAPEK